MSSSIRKQLPELLEIFFPLLYLSLDYLKSSEGRYQRRQEFHPLGPSGSLGRCLLRCRVISRAPRKLFLGCSSEFHCGMERGSEGRYQRMAGISPFGTLRIAWEGLLRCPGDKEAPLNYFSDVLVSSIVEWNEGSRKGR
ncbi:hypothetical protein CEXT_271221 [Caerostris extrusa]|uniref:Uncharacterized protein n=1 Tax=Caerostris extrusa TaxID=172846 RepID=A0AAV4T8Z5_CAEEX|nr:hypothetical protein CEXT_271221 [Caerostris extrusa]